MCEYTDFIEDYNNPNLTAHDVRRINNLNSKQYQTLRNTAISNGDIPATRHMNKTTAKFYSKRNDGCYEVQKTTDGKKLYVGRFPNETTAQKVVAKCIEHNWRVNEIKDFINSNKVKPKSYSIVKGYYIVQKQVNGVNRVFARVPVDRVDEEVIKQVGDEFRRLHWNIGYKDEVLNLFNIK